MASRSVARTEPRRHRSFVRSFALVSALASFAVLIAAGCGDGGSEAALSKAQFIKRGDAICEKADETQNAGLRGYTAKNAKKASTQAGKEDLVTIVGLPPVKTEVEELHALGPPSGDEAKVEAILTGIEEALEDAEENPQSIEKRAGNPFNAVDELAREYGFKACAQAL